MRRVSRRMSSHTCEYTLDSQSRQDESGQCRDSMNNFWRRKTEARWRRPSHQIPGVGSGISQSRSLKNTCIQNLRDPVDAELAVMLSYHMKHT